MNWMVWNSGDMMLMGGQKNGKVEIEGVKDCVNVQNDT